LTLVTIGRVAKPHGLRGEVAVEVLTDVVDRFAAGTEVVVGGVPATVATSRPHQGRQLVRFDHVTDRSAAEALRGQMVEAAPLDTSEFDTYFAHELVGMPVIDDVGTLLGHVRAMVELPPAAAYDLLEVEREDGSMWLLPAADELVEVDEGRLRVLELPEGLLELGSDPEAPDHAAGDDGGER
jgi:16S rRNA processing protein RimM